MTSEVSPSGHYAIDLKDYIQEKQNDFLRLLELTYNAGEIDDANYKRLLLETCDAEEWHEAEEHFLDMYSDIINCIENHELFILESRIVKGAELIEKETDPVKKQKYMQLYDALIAEHTALKEGRTHEQAEAV